MKSHQLVIVGQVSIKKLYTNGIIKKLVVALQYGWDLINEPLYSEIKNPRHVRFLDLLDTASNSCPKIAFNHFYR